ncbi:MAG: hypothetical protein IJX80_06310, partial [Clostridia bacterium]|nr:hypothetical protein [Clostridia bacterium]
MHSIIAESALRAADAIRRAVRNSRAAELVRNCGNRMTEALSDGRLSPLSDSGFDRSGTLYRLRRAGMRARESSFLGRTLKRLQRGLLESRMSDFGLFFLLTGILFLILTLLIPAYANLRQHAVALTLSLFSLPLLPSSKSLSHVLRHSRAIGLLLFGLCELPPDHLEIRRTSVEHPLGVLTATALSVVHAALISPFWWGMCAISSVLLLLLLTFP